MILQRLGCIQDRADQHTGLFPQAVGWPAVQAIIGTRLLPGLLDRILGRTAVDGQQTREPLPVDRPDNLWQPVAGDHGVHGRFDAQAIAWSAQLWLTTHRALAITVALALLLVPSLVNASP
jgi:hypothetical protein